MTQRAIDWGAPRPAEWPGPRERVVARIPVDLVAALKARARIEGVSINTCLQRVLQDALAPESDPILEGAWYDSYTPFR